MKIKSCPEFFNDITTHNLAEALAILKEDHKRRKGGHALGIFKYDIKEDLKEIKRHIKAFETVLLYYGVEV